MNRSILTEGKRKACGSRRFLIGVAAGILLTLTEAPAAPGTAHTAAADFFENRVRPVLVEHCIECHGEKKQKGGLRLDSRAAALSGGDLGAAMVPGDPQQSLMIKAIGYADEDLQMPPKTQLPAAMVQDLTEWVKLGAVWPDDGTTPGPAPAKPGSGKMEFTAGMKAHWAFQPITRPAVPQPKNAAWCRTDIDRFILARLEAANLTPAPPAPAAVLLRRLNFDLTGLPPGEADIASFTLPEFESRLNALLASPHYGEHWGRHWLDVARYADSVGSEVDHAMANAWRYRDYVVRSFNADLPFDRFIQEQLAADLLPDAAAHPDTIPATGLLVLGPKALAELDKAKLIGDVVDEQVDTVSRAFMGLTMGCARCHDHKFDPLGDEDYYGLAGIFQSTKTLDNSKRVATWTEHPLGTPAELARGAAIGKQIAGLREERAAVSRQTAPVARTKPEPAQVAAPGAFKMIVVEAEDFTRANVRVENDSLGKGIGVIRTRMEYPDHVEYDFELPAAGDYQLELRYAARESRPTQLSLNGNLEEMDAAAEVTGDWVPAAQRWFRQGSYALRAGKNTLALHRDGPVPVIDKWLIGSVLPDGRLHSASLSVNSAAPKPAAADEAKKQRLKELDANISSLENEREKMPYALAAFEGPVADVPILARGNPDLPGQIVPRSFPAIIAGIPVPRPGPAQSGRLELARWLTHPQHPLTARVMVNRVWLWHFGEGLVRSPDNFGLRGEPPSHPELLDWLATWFMDQGWSLKKLHHLICRSAVYQQSTLAAAPEGDPGNALLSHWSRRRLTAEELRDAMLAVSGQLDRRTGGTLMDVMNRTYANGGNAPADIVKKMHYDAPRRSLYLPIIRNALNDFLATFDYPDPGLLTGHRAQTTVAPQALFLLNSPFVKQQAAAFAKRLQPLSTDEDRLQRAFILAYGLPPGPAAMAASLTFLSNEERILTASGDQTPRETAWTRLCHSLLAASDFLYLR